AFDDEAPDAPVDRQHLAALTFIVACFYFDGVVGFDVHDFRLSTFDFRPLHDLACETHDLHEVAFTQLAGDGAEDAGAAGIVLGVNQHDGVGVELDVAAILAAGRTLGANDDRSHDGFLFQFAAGDHRLDTADDDVAQAC